jgi:hypothetical protein
MRELEREVQRPAWSRCAIHFKVIVVSCRNRQESCNFARAPFRRRDNSSSLHLRMGAALLADIQEIFAKSGRTRLSSKELLNGLCALSERPWLSAARAARSPFNWLASQLKTFGIASGNVRLRAQRAKGYELSDFAGAFARFLENGPESSTKTNN